MIFRKDLNQSNIYEWFLIGEGNMKALIPPYKSECDLGVYPFSQTVVKYHDVISGNEQALECENIALLKTS